MNDTQPTTELNLKDALCVKSAELWLEVGRPIEAFLELQHLSMRAWEHPWVMAVFDSVANFNPLSSEVTAKAG